MKKLIRIIGKFLKENASIVLGLLFIALSGYLASELYVLPERILTAVERTEHAHIERANMEISSLYFWFGVDFLLVFALLSALNSQKLNKALRGEFYVTGQEQKIIEDKEKIVEETRSVDDHLQKLESAISKAERDIGKRLDAALKSICRSLDAGAGAFYVVKKDADIRYIEFIAGYAFIIPDSKVLRYEFGEGLAGQAAKSCSEIILTEVPEGYISIISGLGASRPGSLAVIPCKAKNKDEVMAVFEVASFHKFNQNDIEFLKKAALLITEKI
ncbi:MAG: hypothetical protein OHK0038_19410 [Flammeovirgaceae bacterium]